MKAMLLRGLSALAQNPTPLTFDDLPEPTLLPGETLLRVTGALVRGLNDLAGVANHVKSRPVLAV